MDMFKMFMQPQSQYQQMPGTQGAGTAMAPAMGQIAGQSLPGAIGEIGHYGGKLANKAISGTMWSPQSGLSWGG